MQFKQSTHLRQSAELGDARIRPAIESAARTRRLRTIRTAGSVWRLHLEKMESRVLLSAYSLNEFPSFFGQNDTGAIPYSTLVADSGGNLFGTAFDGGAYGAGTVFEIAKGVTTITTLASFNGANGANPPAGLTADSSGNLFGTTFRGGSSNDGTVFEMAKGSTAITTLASFDGTNPYPSSGLTLDSLGNLYGTTAQGPDSGSVFELTKGSTAITQLAYFGLIQGRLTNFGSEPFGGVTLDGSGNIYGTTFVGGYDGPSGGNAGDGTVFELPSGSQYLTTLAEFKESNGASPLAGLTSDTAGNLYGTARSGGANEDGTVFEIAKGSTTITALASFNGTNGATPYARLTLDSSGNFYGTTSEGGANNDGTLFEIASGSTAITTLASFNGANGSNPSFAGVILEPSGNLFGTTSAGGGNNEGTVFERASGSIDVTTIASFHGTNGQNPNAGLALDLSGNLYGTTFTGGSHGDGTVFEIAAGSTAMATLASFDGADGSGPVTTVTLDGSGNLFGTTSGRGANDDGTVFEIAKGSAAVTTLASLGGTNASGPAAVTLDASGNLFGTTTGGGASNDGTVFEIARGSTTITTLASFNGTNGMHPFASPTLDAMGNLYGTTNQGGFANDGTVFEIAKGSTALTTIVSFDTANGAYPSAALTLDSSRNLYGTTPGGGTGNDGVVFEIASGSTATTTLASFNGANGSFPYAGVILDPSGNLFGTTNDDTVFEIARGSTLITTLVSFDTSAAMQPNALTMDSSGNLYGTTYGGGPGNPGTVFELVANSVAKLAPTGGPNPSNANQPLTFMASFSAGIPNGETATLVDANNHNRVVASGTISNASATFAVPAGTLLAGTHDLVAAYGGDANFAASESPAIVQTVQVAVTGVTVNGNLPALAGVQRSMVNSIVYTFSEAVNLATSDAFSIAARAGQIGNAPTLVWTALHPGSDGSGSQWVVTFSGVGVSAGSIADGVYDITLAAAAATSDANPSVNSQTRPTDTFYRLFGDAQGTGKVNTSDYTAFLSSFGLKSTLPGYLAYFADDGTGKIDSADYNAFLGNFGKKLSGFTATI